MNRTNIVNEMLQNLKDRQAKILSQAKVDFFNNQKVETSTRYSRWSK
jgi:hypothetical protein